MNSALIGSFMHGVANLFLVPVLFLMILLFFYSFYALGGFLTQSLQRRRGQGRYEALKPSPRSEVLPGYPLFSHFLNNAGVSLSELELHAAKELEVVSIVTRIAPMLGLVATMIPMGPALKALSESSLVGISDNLVVAFSAVILGLITASITFWVSSVKKRWLMAEYADIQAIVKRNAAGVHNADHIGADVRGGVHEVA